MRADRWPSRFARSSARAAYNPDEKAAEDGQLVGRLPDRVREVPVVLPVGGQNLGIVSGRKRRECQRVEGRACVTRSREQAANAGDQRRNENGSRQSDGPQPPQRHAKEERKQERPEGVEAQDVEAPQEPSVQQPEEEQPADPAVEEAGRRRAAGSSPIQEQPEADAEEDGEEADELVLDEELLEDVGGFVESGGRDGRLLLLRHVGESREDQQVRSEHAEESESAQRVDERQASRRSGGGSANQRFRSVVSTTDSTISAPPARRPGVSDSPRISQPRKTATTGLT